LEFVGQHWHAAEPASLLNHPASQAVQALLPFPNPEYPALQVQEDAKTLPDGALESAGHGVHVAPFAPKKLLLQAQSVACELPDNELELGGHNTHSPGPTVSLYFAGSHARHSSFPDNTLYEPLAHEVQSVATSPLKL